MRLGVVGSEIHQVCCACLAIAQGPLTVCLHLTVCSPAVAVCWGIRDLAAKPEHFLIPVYLEQRDALARFLRARLGSHGDIEDLLQDLYLKIVSLDPDYAVAEPRAFLYRLASNLLLDRARSSRRSQVRDTAWRQVAHHSEGAEDVADSPSAEAAVMDRQHLRRLLDSLGSLPERTQSIFRMHKFDGLSYAEVAATLGISRSSVEKHMISALRQLARERRS